MTNPTSPRERLLSGARKLFALQGFAGTSVREIAREAQVNPSMISYHFGGKEGLYHQVLIEALGTLEETLKALENKQISPAERVRAYVKGIIALHRRTPDCTRLFLQELQHPSRGMSEDVLPRIRLLARGLQEALEEGQAAGDLRRDIPAALGAYLIASMVNFYFFQGEMVLAILPQLKNEEILQEGICKIFFEGMCAR